MRLLEKFKLSYQLLLILLVIPIFLVVSLLYYSAIQHIISRNKPLEQMALSASRSVSEKTDANLYERYGDVQAFAFNPLCRETINKEKPDSSLIDFMNTMASCYQVYDLSMVCDISGKVIAVNTKDKDKNNISSSNLIGKSMNDREWFRSSIVVGGPKGGAYYSDFNEDEDVAILYNNKGYGMDFSAPIRNSQGDIIGVFRNRVSWKEVAQSIRKEAEQTLQKDVVNGALILLMDKQGHLIDADKENNILKVNIGKNNLFNDFDFTYDQISINKEDYIYGWTESKGLRSYSGNKWKFLTLIPKVKITDFSVYTDSDWTGLLIFSVVLLLIGIIISLFFVRGFSSRLNKIKLSVQKLSKGEPEFIEKISRKDEIGEMAVAINILNHNFKNIAEFSNEIGQGNLSVSYKTLGEQDVLGNSLLKMQKNLKEHNDERQIQTWTSDALTSFGELLRLQEELGTKERKIISFLAKTVGAAQGALFIVNYAANPTIIELKAGYALIKKQLDNKIIYFGEGTVGQCIIDKKIIRLENIPEEYTNKINSGLGEALPVEVILLPVIFNDRAEGVIEFSSFGKLDIHKIAFLEKAAEYIGSYLAQIKITYHTERVLLDS